MKLILRPTELKVFLRAINTLGKFGHEIYFDWTVDGLSLKAVNSSRSAYAVIHFKRIFFDKLSDCCADSEKRFKISCSFCSSVFKLTSSLEKNIIKCKICLSSDETTLVVQYFCRFSIVKTYNMALIDCEHLEAVYATDECANHLVLSVRLLSELLTNFRMSFDELTIVLKEGECILQNYFFREDPSLILTQIPLNALDFDAYSIGLNSELTFCQKELRVLLNFCDLISPTLRIYCDSPGKPIVFACTHETRLAARFVLATLPSESQSGQSQSQRSQSFNTRFMTNKTPVQLKRSSNHNSNISETTHLQTDYHSNQPAVRNSLPTDLDGSLGLNNKTQTMNLDPLFDEGQADELIRSLALPNESALKPINHYDQMSSTFIQPNSGPNLEPPKKIRSILFSHFELPEEEEEEETVPDSIDREPIAHTRPDDTHRWGPLATQLVASTPGRTVLVADSDEEN